MSYRPRSDLRISVFCVTCLIASSVGAVEIVHLKNGDKLTGTLLGVKGGALRLQTDYAGEVLIQRDQVATIESDRALVVQFEDGTRLTGTLRAEEGAPVMQTDDGAAPITPASIAFVAPDVAALDAAVKDARPKKWSGTVDSGLTLRQGERDTFDFVTGLQFQRKVPTQTLTLKLEAAYGEVESTLSTQRVRGETKWQFFPKEKDYYYYVLNILEHDETRQLDFRGTAGAGFGYKFIENERRNLSAEAGLDYVLERWENFAQGERRDLLFERREAIVQDLIDIGAGVIRGTRMLSLPTVVQAGRLVADFRDPDIDEEFRYENHLNLRLLAHYDQVLFKNSKISEDLTFLPNLGDFGEFRAINELAFTTPIAENLSLRVSLKNEYDSEPGQGNIEKWDTILVTGVRWEFKP